MRKSVRFSLSNIFVQKSSDPNTYNVALMGWIFFTNVYVVVKVSYNPSRYMLYRSAETKMKIGHSDSHINDSSSVRLLLFSVSFQETENYASGEQRSYIAGYL